MISFVYFDVGGVLDLDFSATDGWEDLQRELGVGITKQEAFERLWAAKERDICTRDNVSVMIPLMNEALGLFLPEDYDLLGAFIKRFQKNPSIWPIVAEIHQKVPVGLLTMMYPGMLKEIMNSGLIPDEKWDIIMDSSREKLTKYDLSFYDTAQRCTSVPAEQILYVENSAKYIEMAKKFGWQTFLYDPKNAETSSKDLLAYFNKNR